MVTNLYQAQLINRQLTPLFNPKFSATMIRYYI